MKEIFIPFFFILYLFCCLLVSKFVNEQSGDGVILITSWGTYPLTLKRFSIFSSSLNFKFHPDLFTCGSLKCLLLGKWWFCWIRRLLLFFSSGKVFCIYVILLFFFLYIVFSSFSIILCRIILHFLYLSCMYLNFFLTPSLLHFILKYFINLIF